MTSRRWRRGSATTSKTSHSSNRGPGKSPGPRVSSWYSDAVIFRRITLIFLVSTVVLVNAVIRGDAQTSGPTTPPAQGAPPASFSALIDQTVALFPRVEAEVVEVQGR